MALLQPSHSVEMGENPIQNDTFIKMTTTTIKQKVQMIKILMTILIPLMKKYTTITMMKRLMILILI
jgi:hypothetical protein